jgi:hypothetical protein
MDLVDCKQTMGAQRDWVKYTQSIGAFVAANDGSVRKRTASSESGHLMPRRGAYFGITRLRKIFQEPSGCFSHAVRYWSTISFPLGKWASA